MDGMASLLISDTEGSYQGASSIAAMLQLIDLRAASTSTPRKKSSRTRSDGVILNDGTCLDLLYEQPDPNCYIVDTMIDAYFGLYYRSFPIVHEPTFRA
jgi:transcriptional regulatory protein GAL4